MARTVQRHGGSRSAAFAAGVSLGLADVGIFAATVARNDALPALLFTGGLAIGLEFMGRRGGNAGRVACATLLMAAAISAKISYGPPAATAMLVLLLRGHLPWRLWWAAILGGIAGLLPCLAFLLIDFAGFRFGVIDYSLYAPQQWRVLNDEADILTASTKVLRLMKYAAAGVILPALAVMLIDRLGQRGGRNDRLALLDAVIIAALVSAYLPDPSFRQYLVPLLPALFLRFGLTFDKLRGRGRPWGLAILAAFAIGGLIRTSKQVIHATREGLPMLTVLADARWLRARMGNGSVVTLAPDRIAGAGVQIDPRFVTGPFLFRIEGRLADEAEAAVPSLSAHEIDAAFAVCPPDTIVTGVERRPVLRYPRGLDAPLDDWARTRHYRLVGHSPGGLRLWQAPRPAADLCDRRSFVALLDHNAFCASVNFDAFMPRLLAQPRKSIAENSSSEWFKFQGAEHADRLKWRENARAYRVQMPYRVCDDYWVCSVSALRRDCCWTRRV